MSTVFTKKKKKQNNLVFVFIVIVLITVFVILQGFSKKSIDVSTIYEEASLIPMKQVNINFQALEKTENFEPFIEISLFNESEKGRKNPFLIY